MLFKSVVFTFWIITDFVCATIDIKTFQISKSKSIQNSGNFIHVQKRSILECIKTCASESSCCSGSYNYLSKTCNIVSICLPQTIAMTNSSYFLMDGSGQQSSACQSPGVVTNGNVVVNDLAPGSTAQVSCDTNFLLCGEAVLTCGTDTTWDHPLPACIGTQQTIVYNGTTYTFVTNPATHTGAKNYCTNIQTDLFDIHSAEENSFLKCATTKFSNGIGWWMGLHALSVGTYTWHSGNPVMFSNWYSPPSLNQMGSCAKFYQVDGFWYERSSSACLTALPFVCKSR